MTTVVKLAVDEHLEVVELNGEPRETLLHPLVRVVRRAATERHCAQALNLGALKGRASTGALNGRASAGEVPTFSRVLSIILRKREYVD